MSEEMALSDNATGDAPMQSDEGTAKSVVEAAEATSQQSSEVPEEEPGKPPTKIDESNLNIVKQEPEEFPTEEINRITEERYTEPVIKNEPLDELQAIKEEIEESENMVQETQDKRGIKRRASNAFSDDGDVEFLGFVDVKQDDLTVEYSQVLERLEAEVSAVSKTYTPVRYVMATPPAPVRANKRPRKDTDGSRPSSAQSSRSEEDNPSASPAQRGRRATTEMSSSLLRVPLERGWKRELVYRAALDMYSRRNADIYYYMPNGKKLRSTREIAEHLSGTGLTLDNFSFFKEPLGVDDPEKEIIRDAKVIRRVESPIASPAPPVEGKRAHKPKAPKGASPEPPTIKSPPAKIKVKSVGSRLSGPTTPTAKQEKQKKATPAATAAPAPPTVDNNNTAAWKKPRAPALDGEPGPAPVATRSRSTREATPQSREATPGYTPRELASRENTSTSLDTSRDVARDDVQVTVSRDVPPKPLSPPVPRRVVVTPPRLVTPPPQPKPQLMQELSSPDIQSSRQVIQPCSMTCGAGVPSLSCVVCLCMYHPQCAGYTHHVSRDKFLCKNCRKSTSPPPLASSHTVPPTSAIIPTPRRVPTHKQTEKRVTLRMKVSGGSDGQRVWAVAGPRPRAPAPRPPRPPRASLPQSLAVINGKRFIVVPRPAPLPHTAHETKLRSRVTNGAAPPSPAALTSPRRRGRPRADDTDHFTAFYNRAHQGKTNIAVQIFQYLGMRELAHCARVCRLWRQLAATPSLWRHVRMKNSQVSDWGGLCAALKRHGTKWLDLRKMLLPHNDTVFWEQFAKHIGSVDTLERLEMCRCPARAVESACGALPGLRALSALAIRDAALDPAPLAAAPLLQDLRLKSMAGLALTDDLTHLAALTHLQHLSLTSIKELGWRACDVIGELTNLESLELGECTFRAEFAQVVARLKRLKRLRLERGTAHCAAPAILRALALLPALTRLELVNIDVKVGFDDALAECKNIQRLLIIPTYVSQSATTNKQVLSGVLRLKETLTHLMWGVTIELLRVTELFIDQCSAGGGARRELGECIPVLKPVPGCRLPMDHQLVAGPPQVEILPLPTLQRLLSAQLPNTKLKLLRIPFHATWRQSLADFQ